MLDLLIDFGAPTAFERVVKLDIVTAENTVGVSKLQEARGSKVRIRFTSAYVQSYTYN